MFCIFVVRNELTFLIEIYSLIISDHSLKQLNITKNNLAHTDLAKYEKVR